MDVCVLTKNMLFYSAVEGVAGAMGHKARQAEALEEVGKPDLLIADGSMGLDVPELAAIAEPMRIAYFALGHDAEMMSTARANGIPHVYRRGALAEQLPRIIAEYAV